MGLWSTFTSLLPLLIPVFFIAGIVYAVRSSSKKKLDHDTHSDKREAEVLTIAQGMGGHAGNKMQMTMVLSVTNPDGSTRQATCTDYVDYANVPRPHDRVFVTIDRRDPNNIGYVGLAGNTLPPSAAYPIDAETLEHNGIAIATVKAVGNRKPLQLHVEVDSTIAPKRDLTLQDPDPDFVPNVGERIYLFLALDGTATRVPLNQTGGRRSDPSANRLDPLVLGPQILLHGKQAKGTVTAATRIWTEGKFARDAGIQRWHLNFHVVPYDRSPAYDAEQDMSFTTPERATAVCHIGAEVALRVDSNDPHTIVTDSIAAGYPNPYPAFIQRWNDAVAAGNADKF